MRKIKFRAWDCEEGIYVYSHGVGTFGEPSTGLEELFRQADRYSMDIEQYTGLKDKNGKEIYEGDILLFKDANRGWNPHLNAKVWDSKCIVEWDDNNYKWSVTEISKYSNRFCFMSTHWFCSSYEVIGNIHENRELLNERIRQS